LLFPSYLKFLMATETEKRRTSQGCSLQQRGRAGCPRRPQETVSDWANGKSLVDPELVVEIERITGVSRHELRPDLSRIAPHMHINGGAQATF